MKPQANFDPGIFDGWRTSRHSGGFDNCVEVAFAATSEVAVRHSKDPSGPVLVFTADEWAAFTDGVRDGEFDPPSVG
jgi:hypothetical protein